MKHSIILAALAASVITTTPALAQVATPEAVMSMRNQCTQLGVGFGFDPSTGQPHCVLPQTGAPVGQAPTATLADTPSVEVDAGNLKGSIFVIFYNSSKSKVLSIGCAEWVMFSSTGTSWKHHNDLQGGIPPNGVYVLNADAFQGYCKNRGDIVVHTTKGNLTASLDAGPGNWDGSTQLTLDQ